MTPEGPRTNTPAMRDENFWRRVWIDAQGLPANLPRVTPGSPDIRQPVGRLFEAMGSNSNPRHLTLLEENVNAIKGRIEIFNAPMAQLRFRRYVRSALNSGNYNPAIDIESFMAPLRETRGTFEYLNSEDIITRMDATTASIYSQLQILELNIPEAEG